MIVERKLTKAQQKERNRLQAKFHVGAKVRLQTGLIGGSSHASDWKPTHFIRAGKEGKVVSNEFGVIKVDFGWQEPVTVGSLILEVVKEG